MGGRCIMQEGAKTVKTRKSVLTPWWRRYGFVALVLTVAMLPLMGANAQIICSGCGNITGTFPPTTILGCPGDTYVQTWAWDGGTLPYYFYDYTWAPSTGVEPASGTTPPGSTSFAIPTTCTIYTLTAVGISPTNEITCGDFECGGIPPMFGTGYTYGPMCTAGNYNIVDFTTTCVLDPCGVYAPHSGVVQMQVNGSTTGASILNGSVNLCCNTKYHFSVWVANWNAGAPAVLSVTINFITYAFAATGCGVWQEFTFDFMSAPCTGTYNEAPNLVDLTTLPGGNDFSLDDISIRRMCSATQTLTICPISPIVGPSTLCTGSTISLSESSWGGSWSSSDITVASVDAMTGVVTGVSGGVATISYTLYSGCFVTAPITVYPMPEAISGTFSLCQGDVTTLADVVGGGVWTSGTPGVATIDGTTGELTAVSAGTTVITYSIGSCFVTAIVTVNPLPTITSSIGIGTICVGTTTTFTGSPGGGTWTYTSTASTFDPSTGIITGVTPGNDVFTYTLPTGCYAVKWIIVDALPDALPKTSICLNSTYLFAGTPIGGTYTTTGGAGTIDWITGLFTGTAVGVNTVTYTTGLCSTTTEITVNALPVIVTTPSSAILPCEGVLNVRVIETSGAPGPLVYHWAPTIGLTTVIPGDWTSVNVSGLTGDVIYTITCTDANGCVGYAYDTVVVPCKIICGIGSSCGTVSLLGLSGTIDAGNYGPGVFYIDNDVTIAGNANFTNAIVAIKPGVTISIQPAIKVTMTHCHLFCCSDNDMWKGIVMQTDGGGLNTAVLHLYKNCLIEDAQIAILFQNAAVSATDLLSTDATIFNRNNYGIYIHNYPSTSIGYPFKINGTVFTSRNFAGFNNTGTIAGGYPCSWPNVPDLQANYTQTSEVLLPMQIDNPLGMPYGVGTWAPYTTATLKTAGEDAYAGILLQKVGPATDFTNPGIVIGKDVLFDNMNYGIYATNSNFTVLGCTFAHIHPHVVGSSVTFNGDGIYASQMLTPTNRNILNVNSATATGFDANSNYFYNCTKAVECLGYYIMTGYYNKIYSDHKIGNAYTSDLYNGIYGFNVSTNSYDFNYLTIQNNYICNVTNGIVYYCGNDYIGNFININNNTINAVPTTWLNGFCTMGIKATNGSSIHGVSGPGGMYINKNEVNLAYNGIYMSGFKKMNVSTVGNNIKIMPEPTTIGTAPQYGVYYANCVSNTLKSNIVIGDVVGDMYNNRMNGYYAMDNTNSASTCNNAQNVYFGFAFKGATNIHKPWSWNYMQNNVNGYWLQGAIGPQWNASTLSDNYWGGTWTGNYMTYVNGITTYPINSKLYIRNLAGYDPPSINNYALPFTNRYQHAPSAFPPFDNGLWDETVAISAPVCYRDASSIIWRTTGNNGNEDSFAVNTDPGLYELRAKNQLYNTDTIDNTAPLDTISTPAVKWIGQMATYKALAADSSLLQSSSVLQQFYALAQQNSRYQWLTDIENHLLDSDLVYVMNQMSLDADKMVNTVTDYKTGVIMADGADADGVVNNYLGYYNLYIKYNMQTLTAKDSSYLQYLANLCPITDGAVVHQARVLYSQVFGDETIIDNTCGDSTDNQRYGQKNQGAIGNIDDARQVYQLYPNPNNGNITLEQRLLDILPINIEVYNATGERIETLPITFTGYTNKVNLGNMAPGLYLFHIINSNGHSFKLKFTIQ